MCNSADEGISPTGYRPRDHALRPKIRKIQRRGISRTVLCIFMLLNGASAVAHGIGPNGAATVDWHSLTIDRVVASTTVWNDFGLTAVGKPARIENVNGRRCIRGGHFSIDVANSYAFDVDEIIELELLIHGQVESDSLFVAYDKNGDSDSTIEAEWPGATEDGMSSVILTLERARFADRGSNMTDIVIASIPDRSGLFPITAPITVCDIAIHRSYTTIQSAGYGRLELTVVDPDGNRVPARVGIYDETGRSELPSDESLEFTRFLDRRRMVLLSPRTMNWPSTNKYTFYVDGGYGARLPARKYQVVVSRGIEFYVENLTVEIRPDEVTRLNVEMKRWADLPSKGWHSGDVHIHYDRRDLRDRESMSLIARAEDLNVAHILQMGNVSSIIYEQGDWAPTVFDSHAPFAVMAGQEDPRTPFRGHTIHLNIDRPVRDTQRYLMYHEVFEEISDMGGISGYAHVHDNGLGARVGLALDVPYGLVDFVEVMQAANLGTDVWFDFLNLGYKIAPAAGSDYPYIGHHVGDVRTYVRTGPTFNPNNWSQGLSDGKSFVTNGPILSFSVNDANMGDVLDLEESGRVRIVADAKINTQFDRLERLELIEQGEVVAVAKSETGVGNLSIIENIEVHDGTWFVIRAFGMSKNDSQVEPPVYTAAVSAPIYVTINSDRTWKRSDVKDIAESLIVELTNLAKLSLDEIRGKGPWWQTGPTWEKNWARLHAPLVGRIQEVIEEYEQLIDESRSDPN